MRLVEVLRSVIDRVDNEKPPTDLSSSSHDNDKRFNKKLAAYSLAPISDVTRELGEKHRRNPSGGAACKSRRELTSLDRVWSDREVADDLSSVI